MANSRCFAEHYASARDKFRRAVSTAGGSLSHYDHPLSGPNGEALSCDVGRIGRQDAQRVFFSVSATHGLEGFLGSAAQLVWLLSDGPAQLAADTAVVMVHAINPWGFAHLSRTTENNVDLNRNFIDHRQPHPDNPGYSELHPAICPAEWSATSQQVAEEAMSRYAAHHGEGAMLDLLVRGQYQHADGINYGGTAPEWSNNTLSAIVSEQLADAERVAFIDWHTGIGGYGEPFFINFNAPDSEVYRLACQWWGEEQIRDAGINGMPRPRYTGLLVQRVAELLGERPMVGAVVEFGTRPSPEMKRALRLDRWLKYHADPTSEVYRLHQLDLIDAFGPVRAAWRHSVLGHALHIQQQTVAGLSRW